jgi:NAD(P)H-dependent FMN reductase
VSGHVVSILESGGHGVELLDLAGLPAALFDPSSYAEKPPEFAGFQRMVLQADGILTVAPEYNGSFPGVLKYFIDMLQFPESLNGTPAAFVGLAAGRWGALRSVEQLEMIFQYRNAHLFGQRVFIPGIRSQIDDEGRPVDSELESRLENAVLSFADFCRRLA